MKKFNNNKVFEFNQQLIDISKGKNLIKALDKYCFFDLCRAIFCFNSWRYTRPHLQFYLTLNYVLCNITCKEQCKIETYTDFQKFIGEISPYYDGTFDDEIIPDFGEIKIAFNKTNYSVLMGTGHNLIFPFLESIEALSNFLNIKVEMQKVLDYVNSLSNIYGNIEPYCADKYDEHKLIIPTEKYFKTCILNYSEVELIDNDFLINLSYELCKNVNQAHFIRKANNYLPLFNPSIIVDAFDVLCSLKDFSDTQKSESSNVVVYDALVKNFDNNPHSENVLFNAQIVKDFENKSTYSAVPFNFIILQNNSALFLINQERCKSADFNRDINEIKKTIKNNVLQVIEPSTNGKCKLYDLSELENIEIIIYDNSIQLSTPVSLPLNNSLMHFTLYDLVSLIYEANNIENIINFCKYIKTRKNDIFMSFVCSGYSGIFYVWMEQYEEIIQGANDVANILTDVYILEWNIFEKYIHISEWYPIKKYDEMFSNPFSWTIEDEKLGFRKLISNCVLGFDGSFRKIKESYIFIAFNFAFEKDNDEWNKRNEAINLIEELIERNVSELENVLIKSNLFNYDGIQLSYMPKHYAKKVDNVGFLEKNAKYVFSDFSVYNNRILIRFAVNEDKLFEDILNSENRTVECEFMKELLQPLKIKPDIDFECIEQFLNNTKHLKKNIETIALELDYVFSNKNLGLWPSEKTFVKVKKSIAIACKKVGIKTKSYKPSETTDVIRDIQKQIIPIFESEIMKYNQLDLHNNLISIISFYLHKKRIEMKRYNIKNSNILTEDAKSHTAENVINAREDSKSHIRDLYYIVDTNLSLNRNEETTIDIKREDLEYLIAFSNILMSLQDCADHAHYNLFGANIDVEDDFTISTNFSNNYLNSIKARNNRIYENIDYKPSLSNDEEMLKKCLQAFYNDTGIHLQYIIQICKYLAKEFSAVFKEQNLPDVYSIKKQDLIADYESILIDASEDSKNNHLKALEYLVIDKTKIRQIDGQANEVVPVWEREKRDNRFEVKPIIEDNGCLIFAPSIMYELSELWINGTLEFYPPYEIGLTQYRKQLDKWKSMCEKQMELDLFNLFNGYVHKTFKNVLLHKIDKQSGHPNELGDYDILAFDLERKIVWNIESKFLGKVGSLKEYYNHQNSFFIKDKKDEKFIKRIKYIEENKKKILDIFGIIDGECYDIKSFMVTNKIFIPDVKNVDMSIVTFHELKKMLKLIYEN